jgi:YnbE-like lipoprotein
LGHSRGRSMDGLFCKRSDVVAPRSWLNPLPAATIAALVASMLAACQPTVKVEAPDKPIVINLNVKIEQEVRVKIDREVEDLLKTQPDLF